MRNFLKRLEILLFVIIALLLLNITITFYYANFKNKEIEVSQEKQLPKFITNSEIKKLMEKIQNYMNIGDVKGLYDMLGPYVKVTLDYEQFNKSLYKVDFAGMVINFVYTHFEYVGNEDGHDFFNLYYKTKFSNGSGTSRITILCDDNTYEVVGFRFQIPEFGK